MLIFLSYNHAYKAQLMAISVYEHTDGPNLLKVENILTSDLKDFQILATTTHKNSFKCNVQRMYIQAIVRHLTDRFPNVEIIDAFNIFNPQSMPASEEERATYGQEKLQVLLRTFGEGPNAEVDSVELNSEWEGMRRLIHTQYSSFTLRQMLRLLCSNQTLRDMFPNLTKLSTIAALIPVSTAECERAFSAMNRIKMDLRNRLKTTTLNSLMRISIEGPLASNFNFDRAADLCKKKFFSSQFGKMASTSYSAVEVLDLLDTDSSDSGSSREEGDDI